MSHPASEPTAHPRRSHRSRGTAVAVGALVVGLLVGGVIGGLVAGPEDGGTDGTPAASGAPSTSPGMGAADGRGAEVLIDEACLRALDAAQQAYGTIDEIGQALADLDAARLDDLIHRLQPLQQQVREGADDCRVVAQLPDASPAPGPPPDPSPSPTPGG